MQVDAVTRRGIAHQNPQPRPGVSWPARCACLREEVIDAYFAEHDEVGTGADARGPALLIIDRQPGMWQVRQILDDPAGDHDWGFDVEVDLHASDEEGTVVLRLIDAGRKG